MNRQECRLIGRLRSVKKKESKRIRLDGWIEKNKKKIKKKRSIPNLINIVGPFMHSSMQ